MGEFGIGQPVPREEDPYLVRGAGRYVDDVRAARAGARLCAALAACPCAHPLDRRRRAPRRCPACSLVLTGNDPAVLALGTQQPDDAAQAARRLARPSSRRSRCSRASAVRYIGDPVAFVVAETLDQAKDAAEAIEVDYETLPAVPTLEEAIAPGAPRGVGRLPGQPGLRARGRQQGGGRRGVRHGRARRSSTAW